MGLSTGLMLLVELDQELVPLAPGEVLLVLRVSSVILMSAHALTSSWGPQPTLPCPSLQVPQLLPATYLHWRTHWLQVRPAGSLTRADWDPVPGPIMNFFPPELSRRLVKQDTGAGTEGLL